MKIEVARIPESGVIVEEEEPPQIMGDSENQVEYDRPIRVRVSANLVGHSLVVRGKIVTTAVLECNRCLKKFDHPVDVADYQFAAEVKGDETIDLTDSIREDIILSLPMKRLCFPGCKGLCPICGQNRNLSPCDCKRPQGQSPFSNLDSLKF